MPPERLPLFAIEASHRRDGRNLGRTYVHAGKRLGAVFPEVLVVEGLDLACLGLVARSNQVTIVCAKRAEKRCCRSCSWGKPRGKARASGILRSRTGAAVRASASPGFPQRSAHTTLYYTGSDTVIVLEYQNRLEQTMAHIEVVQVEGAQFQNALYAIRKRVAMYV